MSKIFVKENSINFFNNIGLIDNTQKTIMSNIFSQNKSSIIENKNENSLFEKITKEKIINSTKKTKSSEKKDDFNALQDNMKMEISLKDFIFVEEREIDLTNKKFDVNKYMNNNSKITDYNLVIKFSVAKNSTYNKIVIFAVGNENKNLTLENLKKIFISYLKKAFNINLNSDYVFYKQMEKFILGPSETAILGDESNSLFVKDLDDCCILIDSKLGMIKYKIIEITFLISFHKFFTDLEEEKKTKNFKDQEIKKINKFAPTLFINKYQILTNPSLEELENMDRLNLKEVKFSISNIYGKVEFFDPIDLENADLEALKLEHMKFEIIQNNQLNYWKLNKPCKVTFFVFSINNREDYFKAGKNLKEFYKKNKIDVSSFKFMNDTLSFNYIPIV